MSTPPIVLVVEDNPELRQVLKEALGEEGFDVIVARDHEEALELLRSRTVDLFIADLESPTETLALLQEDFPELPVVAMSGRGQRHPSLFFGAWRTGGRCRTLYRPFRLSELIAVSRDALASGSPHS